MAPIKSLGKSGQLLHMLPPLTVKSTISDAVFGPSLLFPVVTRILETVSQKKAKLSNFRFKVTLEILHKFRE